MKHDFDDSMSSEIADVLREDRDAIAHLVIEDFLERYPDSRAAELDRSAHIAWAEEYLEYLEAAMRGQAIRPFNFNISTGDVGANVSPLILPIVTLIETWLFLGQTIAPFLWRKLGASPRNAQTALETLERVVLEILKVNSAHFASTTLVPGSLSRTWTPSQRAQTAERYEAKPAQEQQGISQKGEPYQNLTHRECDIARLVAEGKSNGEIAASLKLARSTVKNHISRIYDKLNINSRAELTRWAIANGLL